MVGCVASAYRPGRCALRGSRYHTRHRDDEGCRQARHRRHCQVSRYGRTPVAAASLLVRVYRRRRSEWPPNDGNGRNERRRGQVDRSIPQCMQRQVSPLSMQTAWVPCVATCRCRYIYCMCGVVGCFPSVGGAAGKGSEGTHAHNKHNNTRKDRKQGENKLVDNKEYVGIRNTD